MTLKNEFKKILLELCKDTTCHAIPRIVKSERLFVKIVWSISFLIFLTWSFYSIINSVTDYLNYDYITNIQIIQQDNSDFPEIIICNLDNFQTEKGREFLKNNLVFNEYEIQMQYDISNKIFALNDSYKQSLSLSLNESILRCYFNGIKCNFEEFTWTFHRLFGNCFSFNKKLNENKIKSQKTVGFKMGLRLDLYVGDIDTMPDFIFNSGYRVIIKNQSTAISSQEGYFVPSGFETNILLMRVFKEMLELPYNDCIVENYNKINRYANKLKNKTYFQSDCLSFFHQNDIADKCNCYEKSFDDNINLPQCKSVEQLNCVYQIWENIKEKGYISLYSKYCPVECNTVTYPLTISTSSYLSNKNSMNKLFNNTALSSKYWNDTLNYDKMKNKVLALNIFYDKLEYTLINQEAKFQILDLVSNIGGLLGLFLGVSLLSFLEIIEFTLEVLFLLVSK